MSESSVKATILETNVETITTVTVEETVATLELTEKTASSSSASSTKAITKGTDSSSSHRELPIFSNPLLANATQSNSVPIKPKSGRVKVGNKVVSVLRISAPKVDGEVVVMRRMDSDLVNATSMYNAAYPAISEKMEAKESAFVTHKYEGTVEKAGTLSGVWYELAKEYEIDQFMRPLLEVPTKNGAANKAITAEGEETIEKIYVSEVSIVQHTTKNDVETEEQQEQEDTLALEDAAEKLDDLSVGDVVVLKRRIEELEDQASRDKKKFRGLVTVAVGLAAATVIPQVLPYFS
ncbi:hypothetical protein BG011_009841 [Mortierella polycephala]|uniref:HTH APSES-type domain-containing protein n=1 Tax=Mortierella polycephala TaxID=41804 RepID=A0A9P6Q962_9FUNG|nr:hypothetical protein BG011_009841 [Mortierella polycephala]